jgi:tRNA (cytidine/uridine-2'-O-)-methyltransferase
MRLALFEPDIPQNVGASIRAAACFGAQIDVIEPCGFAAAEREIKRVAMDYGVLAPPTMHRCWDAFLAHRDGGRLVLMTTKGATSIWDFVFAPDDAILLGRESAGVPGFVHESAQARVLIPMAPDARSLNVAVAGAIALAEAQRQFGLA